ncbi:hypothetical protein T4C_6845, partial [Trichinella pseudospiralis]
LGRWSARFPTLEREKPRLSALKRWVRLSCFTYLRCVGREGRLCVLLAQQSEGEQSSLLFGQVKRTLPDPGAGKA